MPDRMIELAERCEAATGPDHEIDAEIYVALDSERDNLDALAINGEIDFGLPEFTASLDAAMTLVPEGLLWRVDQWADGASAAVHTVQPYLEGKRRRAATPALALTAAALRTIASQEQAP